MFASTPSSNRLRSPIGAVDAVCIAAVAAYLALFVYFFARASILEPYSDLIDLLNDYFRAADLNQQIEYLFQPHNLHRIVWLRGLIAVDVGLLHGTGWPSVAVAVICLAGAALFLAVEIGRVAGRIVVPLSALVVMLVFLSANAGLSVPANTPHLHATFFSLLALGSAASAGDHHGNWRHWTAAITFAIAASLSLAMALVLWPILATMAWLGRASLRTIGLITAAGVAFCAAYLANQSVGATLPGFDQRELFKAVEYFLAYLGLPWVRGARIPGEMLGAALAAASIYALMRYGLAQTSRTQRLALGMITFSLAGGFLAAILRRDISTVVDVPIRYTILMLPLHAGLLLLAAPALARAWESRRNLVTQGLLLTLILLMGQQIAVGLGVSRSADRTRQTIALYHQGERTAEMLQFVHPNLPHAAAMYAEMRRRDVFLQFLGPNGPSTPAGVAKSQPSEETRRSNERATSTQ